MQFYRWLLLLVVASALSGCATSRGLNSSARQFEFGRDTFAYANELVWEYSVDPLTGQTTAHHRDPRPDYTLHCFVLARTARQFFEHAHFDPGSPKADEATYRKLIHEIVARTPRRLSSESERVVIPGYPNLREFSEANERLLKNECGGAWQSYVQRGNWRMIFPFSRGHQKRTAQQLKEALARNWPPVVHIVRFPTLAVNHAMLIFDFSEEAKEIHFRAYDPNNPSAPTVLRFDRVTSTFFLPPNSYFAGGRVDVYEIYSAVNY